MGQLDIDLVRFEKDKLLREIFTTTISLGASIITRSVLFNIRVKYQSAFRKTHRGAWPKTDA